MSSPDVILYVPNREVDWVVFVLARRDRGRRFVGSKDDGDEDCPVCVDINGNKVLFVTGLVLYSYC